MGRRAGRMILAQVVAKRGLPDSPRCLALRQAQAHQAAQPTSHELAQVIVRRLQSRPGAAPLDVLEPILTPTTAEEATRSSVPSGSRMPSALRRVLTRCLEAPVDAPVEGGAIPSGEVLARVIPQLTSRIGASGFADATLGRLYGAVYEAFRRRRSLPPLNLAKQIRIGELPWVAAMAGFLTTHNLAVLVDGLGLRDALEPRLPELARRCFTWICWRQQLKSADWRSRLHTVKNTAFAWRQMVFFLSLASKAVTDEFLAWAESHFTAQRQSLQSCFRPALSWCSPVCRGTSAAKRVDYYPLMR